MKIDFDSMSLIWTWPGPQKISAQALVKINIPSTEII